MPMASKKRTKAAGKKKTALQAPVTGAAAEAAVAAPAAGQKTPELAPGAAPAGPEAGSGAPLPGPSEKGGGALKAFAIVALLAVAAFLAYYFMVIVPENSFMPGAKVDAETFKNLFLDATKVYIVMDIRGAQDYAVSNNILQCGVDFAASSGMGGKYVTPLSISRDGCVTPDGVHQPKECFAMMKDGMAVYVREGSGSVDYYSNGMVVYVGRDYALGSCSIKRL